MHSPTLIGLVQAVPRKLYPIRVQRSVCTNAGASPLIEITRTGPHSLSGIAATARPEVHYACQWLWLLAPIKGEIAKRRAALIKFVGEIEARGSCIVEIGSQRRTDDANQRSMMLADAMTAIARRQQPGAQRKGGRKRQGTPEDDERARQVWRSLDYKTNAEAEKHFPKGWGTESKAYRLFGPSGRPRGYHGK